MTVSQKHEIYQECVDFLNHEADLLDKRRFKEWFELFSKDITYQIPIRVTRELNAPTEFSARAFHMDETWGSLDMRIRRIYTEYNWAEDPASRTRHFVSNVKIDAIHESQGKTEVQVRTNILLFRNRFDSHVPDLLSGERADTLRKIDGKWQLAKRIVYLDHTTLPTNNLAVFF